MSPKRALRGTVGIMATWAVAFAIAGVVGIVPLVVLGALPPFELETLLRFGIDSAIRWALGGAAMGLVFATTVLLSERKRTLATLSSRRFAVWGFVGGAIVPIGMATIYTLLGRTSPVINLRSGVVFAGICGALGAALAASSLRAARRTPAALDEAARVHAPVV